MLEMALTNTLSPHNFSIGASSRYGLNKASSVDLVSELSSKALTSSLKEHPSLISCTKLKGKEK